MATVSGKVEFTIPNSSYKRLPKWIRTLFPENIFGFHRLITTNTKKNNLNEEMGWGSGGIYMAPNDSIGLYNVCGSETQWCKAACIAKGKRYGLQKFHKALICRNLYYGFYREEFRARVADELFAFQRTARRRKLRVCFRMNGTSDIAYESTAEHNFLQALMGLFPEVTFYDYTKHFGRMNPEYKKAQLIENYHLTFSHSGDNWKLCQRVLEAGGNVSVVFPKTKALTKTYKGFPVVDGDAHDLIFLHPPGSIVGLREKKAYRRPADPQWGWVGKKETGPFVVELTQ